MKKYKYIIETEYEIKHRPNGMRLIDVTDNEGAETFDIISIEPTEVVEEKKDKILIFDEPVKGKQLERVLRKLKESE